MSHFEIIKGRKASLYPEGTVFDDNQMVPADEEKALFPLEWQFINVGEIIDLGNHSATPNDLIYSVKNHGWIWVVFF